MVKKIENGFEAEKYLVYSVNNFTGQLENRRILVSRSHETLVFREIHQNRQYDCFDNEYIVSMVTEINPSEAKDGDIILNPFDAMLIGNPNKYICFDVEEKYYFEESASHFIAELENLEKELRDTATDFCVLIRQEQEDGVLPEDQETCNLFEELRKSYSVKEAVKEMLNRGMVSQETVEKAEENVDNSESLN